MSLYVDVRFQEVKRDQQGKYHIESHFYQEVCQCKSPVTIKYSS